MSMGPGRWLESYALPVRNRGMLVVEPRENNDATDEVRLDAAIRLDDTRDGETQ